MVAIFYGEVARKEGRQRGCLLAGEQDVTEVHLQLLRKTASIRLYTALGLVFMVVVDFCFSSLKSFYLQWVGGRGREWCCGSGKEGEERLLPRKEREESIKKCPDWLKKASRRREEKRRSLLVCADWVHLQSDCCGVRRGPLPSRPRRGWLSQGCNLLGDQLEVSE